MLTKGDGTWFLITWWRTTSCLGVATTKNYHLRSFWSTFTALPKPSILEVKTLGVVLIPVAKPLTLSPRLSPPCFIAKIKIVWQIVMASCASWRRPWRDWERNPWPQSSRPFFDGRWVGLSHQGDVFFFAGSLHYLCFFVEVFFCPPPFFKGFYSGKWMPSRGSETHKSWQPVPFRKSFPPNFWPWEVQGLIERIANRSQLIW